MNVDDVKEVVAGNARAELARARVEVGDAAEAMGISRSGLTKKLAGTNPFTVSEIVALANLLGVSPAVLIAPPTGLEPVTL